jgi:F420-dependent oxidoreductase-like protein
MAALFFGYHMPNYTFAGARGGDIFHRFLDQALAAEAAGFDLVTVMDHYYQIRGVGPETDPMMEAYTTLGAMAARTSRTKLATLVTGVTYRNPALVAKMVTTLDVISNGRAIMGIGAAWNDSEHAGLGFEFPPIGERMDRLEEAVTIAKLMFTQGRPSFEGKHYRIDRAINVPRPVQPGGPKILIGGGGEKRTLRILAKHGDIGHWFGGPVAELKRKRQVFLRHCETEGRDPSEVMLLMGSLAILVENPRDAKAQLERIPEERRPMVIVAPPAEVAERLQPYVDAGFAGFTLSNQTLPTGEAIALGGELIRLMAGARSPA